ncbi:MAG: alpha/beta hydrolase [Acetivibrio sp.]
MHREKPSIKGVLIREMIADITSTSFLGESIQTGKYRMNPKEPLFLYPPRYHCKTIQLENFSLEYLKRHKENSSFSVLQLHGGGYIGPMKNSYRKFSISYLEKCGQSDVITIDYRVAPEHPYPAALEDAFAAYSFIVEEHLYNPGKLIIVGDSAGGGLALALCMYLRDHGFPKPAGLVLMSPWADLTNSGESHTTNLGLDPLFGNTTNNLLYNSSYIGDHDPKDPYLSPIFGDFTNLPPMLIQVGTHEVLLSDSKEIASQTKLAGNKVKLSIYEGMFHVFQMSGDIIPESRRAWDEVGEFFKAISGKIH